MRMKNKHGIDIAKIEEFYGDYHNTGCWGEIWNDEDTDWVVGFCPECGCPIDSDGKAMMGCSYSPIHCEKCGFKWCDNSC